MCNLGIHSPKIYTFLCKIIAFVHEFFVDCISFFLYVHLILLSESTYALEWISFLFIFFVGCPATYSEVSDRFKVWVQSDLPFIPRDFSKSWILNIQKVRVGSDKQYFKFFGQFNSLFIVIKKLIMCNMGIALENTDLYNPFFVLLIPYPCFFYNSCTIIVFWTC